MFDSIHVLIVEDDPSVRNLLTQAISAQSFQVLTAATFGEAVREMPEADIMCLDLVLNGQGTIQSGESLLDQWVTLKRNAPVVVVSGKIIKKDENRLLLHGADNVLAKPFEISVMLHLMFAYGKKVLDQRRLDHLENEIEGLDSKVKKQLKRCTITIMVLLLALLACMTRNGLNISLSDVASVLGGIL